MASNVRFNAPKIGTPIAPAPAPGLHPAAPVLSAPASTSSTPTFFSKPSVPPPPLRPLFTHVTAPGPMTRITPPVFHGPAPLPAPMPRIAPKPAPMPSFATPPPGLPFSHEVLRVVGKTPIAKLGTSPIKRTPTFGTFANPNAPPTAGAGVPIQDGNWGFAGGGGGGGGGGSADGGNLYPPAPDAGDGFGGGFYPPGYDPNAGTPAAPPGASDGMLPPAPFDGGSDVAPTDGSSSITLGQATAMSHAQRLTLLSQFVTYYARV